MRRRLTAVVTAVAAVLAGVAVLYAPASPASASASAGPAFTKSETIMRDHLVSGADQVVDTRNVTVTVDNTTNLRSRQEVTVSWSGARPSAGIVADPNSSLARETEYPVVLLQCRGVDSSAAPSSQQLSPSTCWTQTANERTFTDFNTAFPPWRVDRYASVANRAAVVGQPAPRGSTCGLAANAEYWVPFAAASGTTFYGGPGDCMGMPPEAADAGSTLAMPTNETFAATQLDGHGTAKFVIWDSGDNASLGCSNSVPCSLVAVPIMGISCDVTAAGLPAADQPAPGAQAAAAQTYCAAAGKFAPGQQVVPSGGEDLAVSGGLWWSASNWRNRITVPLAFAPPTNACDIVNSKAPTDLYGSELLTQATTQWAPYFCLSSHLFPLKHVHTGEPEAKSLLNAGNVEAALASEPPATPFSRPVVTAPVSVSGFAITYTIDGADGLPYPSLRLTARLLAKLMTESYPAVQAIKTGYAALSGNPLNVSLDPEFIALNPGITQGVGASAAASALLSLASDSDVIYALTSYINADPEARAWLNGTPDPWGMTVNPNYKGISLPVISWPLLDSYEPLSIYQPGLNDCLYNNPVPYLPLVAAPMSRMGDITLAMQFAIGASQTVCSQTDQGTGQKLVPIGRESPGFRFMIAVTPIADALRYQINVASLQTYVNPTSPAKFTSGDGRTFVTPSDASLLAAAKLLSPDAASSSWPVPYNMILSDPNAASAYPGTMVVYADIPTSGLPRVDAAHLATFLTFAAGPGQQPGLGFGQLPPGYLPVTAANGLASMVAYTKAAATYVAGQSGTVPSVTAPVIYVAPPPSSTPSSHGTGSGSGVAAAPTASTPTGSGSASPLPTPSTSGPTAVALGTTASVTWGATALVLPGLLLLALMAGVVAMVIGYFGGRGRPVPARRR